MIQQACHLFPWSEKVFVDCLTAPYFAKQLISLDQTIGYYVGLHVLDEMTLMDIGVSAAHRSQGYAKRLLLDFERECLAKSITQIWLEVRKSNQYAIKLYENQGFEIIEERKNYYPTKVGKEDAFIMKKALVQN